MRLSRPQTIAEALRQVADDGEESKVVAGGTALMLMLRNGFLFPDHLIALEQLAGLDYVEVTDEVIRIGALRTLRALQRTPELVRTVPTFTSAVRLVANHRVRHRATLGGNLSEADYASDPPAVLETLNARVRLASIRSERVLPLSEFLVDFYQTALAPDELVTEVEIPRPPPNARTTYLKYVSRSAEDRPCLGVSVYLDADESGRCRDVRIAVAGATATPFTLQEVTEGVRGSAANDGLWDELAAEFGAAIEPISDGRGSAEYRKRVTGVLLRRALRTVSTDGRNGAVRL